MADMKTGVIAEDRAEAPAALRDGFEVLFTGRCSAEVTGRMPADVTGGIQ